MPHYPKPFFRKNRRLWYVQIDGKQHNLGPDRDKAFELYFRLMQEPQQSPQVVGESVLALIDQYLDWCKQHRAAATFEWYRWRLQLFCESIPEDLTVADLKPFHVQEWIDSQSNWSSGSKRNGCKAVQRALRWAEQQGYIDRSPVTHMQKPAMGRREVVISDKQFEELLELSRSDSFTDLLRVTWDTGCRPQESLRVEARHVDMAGSRWVIPVSESKTDIVRVVYLTEPALAITRRLCGQYPAGPLFRNSRGAAWTKDSVNNAFHRIQIRKGKLLMNERGIQPLGDEIRHKIAQLKPTRRVRGIEQPKTDAELRHEAKKKLTTRLACELAPRFCLYHIRHTWMNRLLRAGVDAMTVAILAGHSDPSVLAKTYQHLSQSPDYLLKQVRSTVISG